MTTDPELRATSDGLLAKLGRLHDLEMRKRTVTPGTPQFEVFPVHMILIPDHGINIIENYDLEEIAAAGEHEFLLVVPPLKIRGGTGSALRSFALVP